MSDNDNRQPGVVLFRGIITQSIHHGEKGSYHDFSRVGREQFFIDVIENDGSLIPMWDGTSYEVGILEAEELGKEFGLPVRDEVVGGAA